MLHVLRLTLLPSWLKGLFRPYAGPNILVGGGLQVVVRGEAADDI